MIPLFPRLVVAAMLLTALSGAQQLQPGTFVLTTGTNSVQILDPFAGKFTPLTIAGLPRATENLFAIVVEDPRNILISTWFGLPSGRKCNVFRATLSSNGWVAKQINTSTLPIGGISLSTLGPDVYVLGTTVGGTRTGTTAKLYRVPLAGGTPSLYVDLGRRGAIGNIGGLARIGSVLHVLTHDTTQTGNTASEHWTVDTSTPQPTVRKIGRLPRMRRWINSSAAPNFACVGAVYDARRNLLFIAGMGGDLLARTPKGVDQFHLSLPGTITDWGSATDFWGSIALNVDTGALAFGDRDAHFEELRCLDGKFRPNALRIPGVPKGTRIRRLAYVPLPNSTPAQYLPLIGGTGCKQSNFVSPCSYVSSLPVAGNQSFAFTLEAQSSVAVLAVGFSVKQWKNTLLPHDLSPLGAPNCLLRTSIDFAFPATLGPSGLVVPMPLPLGFKIDAYTQWLVSDPQANRLGVVVSEARHLQVR